MGLDWTGVEQLTDKFFLLAEEKPYKLRLNYVTQVVLRGCRYITDTALHALGTIAPSLETVGIYLLKQLERNRQSVRKSLNEIM